MSKRPTDVDEPAAKKRASDRQIAREDPSEDEEEVPAALNSSRARS